MFRSYFKIYQTILYRKSLRVKAIKMRLPWTAEEEHCFESLLGLLHREEHGVVDRIPALSIPDLLRLLDVVDFAICTAFSSALSVRFGSEQRDYCAHVLGSLEHAETGNFGVMEGETEYQTLARVLTSLLREHHAILIQDKLVDLRRDFITDFQAQEGSACATFLQRPEVQRILSHLFFSTLGCATLFVALGEQQVQSLLELPLIQFRLVLLVNTLTDLRFLVRGLRQVPNITHLWLGADFMQAQVMKILPSKLHIEAIAGTREDQNILYAIPAIQRIYCREINSLESLIDTIRLFAGNPQNFLELILLPEWMDKMLAFIKGPEALQACLESWPKDHHGIHIGSDIIRLLQRKQEVLSLLRSFWQVEMRFDQISEQGLDCFDLAGILRFQDILSALKGSFEQSGAAITLLSGLLAPCNSEMVEELQIAITREEVSDECVRHSFLEVINSSILIVKSEESRRIEELFRRATHVQRRLELIDSINRTPVRDLETFLESNRGLFEAIDSLEFWGGVYASVSDENFEEFLRCMSLDRLNMSNVHQWGPFLNQIRNPERLRFLLSSPGLLGRLSPVVDGMLPLGQLLSYFNPELKPMFLSSPLFQSMWCRVSSVVSDIKVLHKWLMENGGSELVQQVFAQPAIQHQLIDLLNTHSKMKQFSDFFGSEYKTMVSGLMRQIEQQSQLQAYVVLFMSLELTVRLNRSL